MQIREAKKLIKAAEEKIAETPEAAARKAALNKLLTTAVYGLGGAGIGAGLGFLGSEFVGDKYEPDEELAKEQRRRRRLSSALTGGVIGGGLGAGAGLLGSSLLGGASGDTEVSRHADRLGWLGMFNSGTNDAAVDELLKANPNANKWQIYGALNKLTPEQLLERAKERLIKQNPDADAQQINALLAAAKGKQGEIDRLANISDPLFKSWLSAASTTAGVGGAGTWGLSHSPLLNRGGWFGNKNVAAAPAAIANPGAAPVAPGAAPTAPIAPTRREPRLPARTGNINQDRLNMDRYQALRQRFDAGMKAHENAMKTFQDALKTHNADVASFPARQNQHTADLANFTSNQKAIRDAALADPNQGRRAAIRTLGSPRNTNRLSRLGLGGMIVGGGLALYDDVFN